MLLSKPEIEKMFHKVAEIWQENKDYLSEIDSRFGDGDHGTAPWRSEAAAQAPCTAR